MWELKGRHFLSDESGKRIYANYRKPGMMESNWIGPWIKQEVERGKKNS